MEKIKESCEHMDTVNKHEQTSSQASFVPFIVVLLYHSTIWTLRHMKATNTNSSANQHYFLHCTEFLQYHSAVITYNAF
jgi:hypothetical protein